MYYPWVFSFVMHHISTTLTINFGGGGALVVLGTKGIKETKGMMLSALMLYAVMLNEVKHLKVSEAVDGRAAREILH